MQGVGAKIFAAEVLGKRSPSEIREDELTSRFLGIFAHLKPATQIGLLDNLGLSKGFEPHEAIDVEFWPRLEGPEGIRELDAIIAQRDCRIGMEFKWRDGGTTTQLLAQLLAERKLLPSGDLLVYITRDEIIPPAVTTARKRLGPRSGSIEWIPWKSWLRAAIDTGKIADDAQDTSLLGDIISLLKVVGVSGWQRGLEQYWEVSSSEVVVEAFNGLGQFFRNLRTRLKDKHSKDYRVGEAQTIFAYKSYLEFTPIEITQFAENLGLYVVLDHTTQRWDLSFELKQAPQESAKRAREVLESVKPSDLRLGKGSMIANRSFVPASDFASPDRLADEIEAALVKFGEEISPAFRQL